MTLTVGTILLLIGQLSGALTDAGLLDADGNLTHHPTPAQIAAAVAKIEALFTQYGLQVPPAWDRLIQLLPILLRLAGNAAAWTERSAPTEPTQEEIDAAMLTFERMMRFTA